MERILIRLTGPDTDHFLSGLLTRDVPAEGMGYAALLTPQGKYLADFLTFREDGAACLDTDPAQAEDVLKRLGMYRLRARVEIGSETLSPARGLGPAPDGAWADPRPGMGWRAYDGRAGEEVDWDAVRVENIVPEAGRELIPGESYILEMDFERLGGVDFRKGCYVGQEIVARMKHKTELRKGLARVRGAVREGAEITANGRPAGRIHTTAGDRALAYLRFDRAEGMEGPDGPLTRD